MKKLQDKVAIVTGAAMGMGASIAKIYAKYGAKLVLTDVSGKLEETAADIRARYGAEVVVSRAEAIARQSCPEDPESALADMAKGIPVKRLASPDEVGELFAFLGSDESSYITGSQFVIDGAATIRESNMGV